MQDGLACPPALDRPQDNVPELGKLRFGLPAFLEIEIRPVVECFDDNCFPPLSGEDDKRRRVSRAFKLF